ncbi:MAG: mechanosensitive ion channel [Campylobacterota bacterium]|nr:mechanosensitive ion channel [Campylobacterota bacterium]
MYIKIIIYLFLVFSTLIIAEPTVENNASTQKGQAPVDIHLQELLVQKETLDNELIENNIWTKIYSNYHTYQELQQQQARLKASISRLSSKSNLSKSEKSLLESNSAKSKTITGKLQLLKEYEKDPFKKFLTPPVISDVPTVGNPFAVIGALSYQEKLDSDHEEYNARYESLEYIMTKFKEKELIIKELLELDPYNVEYQKNHDETLDQIKTFTPVIEIFQTTNNVHTKKVDEIKLNLSSNIKQEISKTFTIGAVILVFILLLLLIKYLVRKYMSDNDRFYTINKAANISFILLSLFTLLFAYIENISYLVTILGFASAGIAIAMKDWFMSLMGWLTIMVGGAIHVGDRVRFVREGVEYVGDIVDISMLRMTMHEDINLTSYMTNRRAGRMIFIPNNYIFTDMIANYSHSGLKTVWDGIDFVVTFDSDAHKATLIAKEITKKYSKGYTEITRKQLNKLRSKYGMRNTNVEPRIFTHIEPYGLKISAWYLTNSYATMTLRSTISIEIVSRIQQEETIHLAFPTQSIYVDKNVPSPTLDENGMPTSKEL